MEQNPNADGRAVQARFAGIPDTEIARAATKMGDVMMDAFWDALDFQLEEILQDREVGKVDPLPAADAAS